jgi:hypothetical protein
MCGLIHNDCHRSIINKFFDFYKFNESLADSLNPLFIEKDFLIESFKLEIIDYLNHNNNYHSEKGFENAYDSKYKFKYYQGMNDLIIFFILVEKTSQAHLDILAAKADKSKNNFYEINEDIISYLKNEFNKNNLQIKNKNINPEENPNNKSFKPFCFEKLNNNNDQNPFICSKLSVDCGSEIPKENSNALKMKKILPTVIKYIELMDPKVKRRLFDLTKIDPFYSLGWILTWFTHNNENIFKNFRIIDYLLFSEINCIFYLVAVVIKFFNF